MGDTSDTSKITIDVSGDFNQASADHERSNWVHRIVLDCDARTVDTCTMYGNGTPGRIWSGVDREIGRINDGVADTDDLRDYLESDEAQALLEAIIAGWESYHDGSNFVGRLTEGAQDAENELAREITEIELPTYWNAGEYLGGDWNSTMQGCDGTDEWFDEHADTEVENAKPDAWLDRSAVREAMVDHWERFELPSLMADGVEVHNGHEVGNGYDASARFGGSTVEACVRCVSTHEGWTDWVEVKGEDPKTLADLRAIAIRAASCPGDFMPRDEE